MLENWILLDFSKDALHLWTGLTIFLNYSETICDPPQRLRYQTIALMENTILNYIFNKFKMGIRQKRFD